MIGIKKDNWIQAIFKYCLCRILWFFRILFQPRHYFALRSISKEQKYRELKGFILTRIDTVNQKLSDKTFIEENEYYELWLTKPGAYDVILVNAILSKQNNTVVKYSHGLIEL